MVEENIPDEQSEEDKTKFLFIMKKSPHGSTYPQEGLEVILIMAAYDQTINVLFTDDGVFCLKKGQDTKGIKVKDFSATFKVLEQYGIEHMYVDRQSLEDRGLKESDLLTGVELVDSEEMREFIREQDVILPF
ncbi:MAG: sulfurtransferase complex subunit TusC [Nitrospinae bacterium]|nr:sulfurtransferase complex subunit TusC [Nitrospinota bacterium]